MFWNWPLSWTISFWDAMILSAEYAVTPLEVEDADDAAAIHAEAFAQAWSGDEFASLLSQPGSFGFMARRAGQARSTPVGVVLARRTLDEAEILTVAVDKSVRGKGIGRLLMDHVLQHLYAERAASLFLEVDETNGPALALYRRLRFDEVGRRPAYYAGTDGQRTSALILKRDLAA